MKRARRKRELEPVDVEVSAAGAVAEAAGDGAEEAAGFRNRY